MRDPLMILGTGMAGLGLARQLRRRDSKRSITLVTADSGDEYSKPLLSTGFAKGLTPQRLVSQSALAVADQLNAVVRTHTRVTGIDPEAGCIELGAEILPYSDLVLALGAAPQPICRVPEELRSRVFSINDLDDYRAFYRILNSHPGSARVAILGTGLVGCEYANDLRAGGHRVAMIAPESAPLARLLPEPLGKALGKAFEEAGIELHTRRYLERMEAHGEGVALQLDDGHALEVDLVLMATGLAPRTRLAEQAGLETSATGIHTDRYLRTSAPHIHALGDAACVAGINAMYVQPLQASAKALAATLAGEPTPVGYGPWPIIVKTPALPVVALPPSHEPARWRLEGEAPNMTALAEDARGNLLGFALTGTCVRRKVELARASPALLG